jgi:hypothetical protein
VVDGKRSFAPCRAQQVACPCLARRIHSVADGRAEAGRIRPLVEYPVGERSEEALHLAVEAAAPAAMKAHCNAMTSMRKDGFTGFSPCLGLLFQYFTIRTSPFHSFE